jgi:hypothetical protein
VNEDTGTSFIKPAIHSQTMRWLLVAFVAYAVKAFGIPMLPDDITGELVDVIINMLDVAINVILPAALFRAAQGRMKAEQAISGWFK